MSEAATVDLKYEGDDEDFFDVAYLNNSDNKLFGDRLFDIPGSQPNSQFKPLTTLEFDQMLEDLPSPVMKAEEEENDQDLEEEGEDFEAENTVNNLQEIIDANVNGGNNVPSTSTNVQQNLNETSVGLQPSKRNKRKATQVIRVEPEVSDEVPRRRQKYTKKVKKYELDPEENPECINAIKARLSRERKKGEFEENKRKVAELEKKVGEVELKNQFLEYENEQLKKQTDRDRITIQKLHERINLQQME